MQLIIRLIVTILAGLLCLNTSAGNTHGVSGLINLPSARSSTESSMSLSFVRSIPDRKYMLTASPYDWLEATIFYVDITGKDYPGINQSYKDKGFNVKAKIFEETEFLPAIAIGANDIAGTGFYNSEYIVFSKNIRNIDFSAGIGWGSLSDGINFKNPLIAFDKKFSSRSESFKDFGGSLDFNNYFSGKKAALFLGAVIKLSESNNLYVEHDSTVVPGEVGYRDSNIDLNVGFSHKINNNIELKASFIRGEDLTIQFNLTDNFLDYKPNQKYRKHTEIPNKYEHLQKILELNRIGLIGVQQKDKKILVDIKQNAYLDYFLATKNTKQAIDDSFGKDASREVVIAQYAVGMNVLKEKIPSYSSFSYRSLENTEESINKYDYIVIENYPIASFSIGIVPKLFIASREGFLYRGLMLEGNSEVVFSEKLILSSNLKYSLSDNFDGLYIPPVDTYPEQVRSDVKLYLNQVDEGIKIGRLQLDYFTNYENNFFSLSAGIFEDMFAGYGFEYLYSEKNSMFMYGFELFNVYKRDYDMRFKLLNYSNIMPRAKIIFDENTFNTRTTLSYGEYLAGDIGYTFEIERLFKNGVKMGFFFSQTDVPISLYGEGSFDKGVKFTIPIRSFFSSDKSLQNYVWRPLTKDPASLIVKNNRLVDIISRYR